jgi:hypothetical protein
MKQAVMFLLSLIFIASTGIAQEKTTGEKKDRAMAKDEGKTVTMKGYVVDAMCAKGIAKKENMMEKAAAHTRECALEDACSASGYGVFSEGKWFKFDDAGDAQAKALLENTKKEKGIAVEVSGTMQGNQFAVASIKETTMPTGDKNMEKKTETKHQH